MSKKKLFFRIVKKSENVFTIDERHRFMFFWTFWIHGSIKLKIAKHYASAKLAEEAITQACAKKGIIPFIVSIDGLDQALKGAEKKARKKARKMARVAEERELNLRRIGKGSEEK